MTDRILILDFGSQVTQLIARRVREHGVYSEIWPFNSRSAAHRGVRAQGHHPVGRPGVGDRGRSRRVRRRSSSSWACRCSASAMASRRCARSSAARCEGSDHREFGRAFLEVTGNCVLFDGLWKPGDREQVWMSHGDRVVRLPPGFRVVGVSDGAPFAVCADDQRRYYGVHVPPGSRAHAAGRQAAAAISCATLSAAPATGPWPPSRRRRWNASATWWGRGA